MGTLELLAILNPVRCKAFGYSVNDKSALSWACKVAGEAGELCQAVAYNADGRPGNDILQIAKEAADLVIYVDLLCTRLGIDLCEAIQNNFDAVSDKVGSNIKFNPQPPLGKLLAYARQNREDEQKTK